MRDLEVLTLSNMRKIGNKVLGEGLNSRVSDGLLGRGHVALAVLHSLVEAAAAEDADGDADEGDEDDNSDDDLVVAKELDERVRTS